MYLQQQAYFLWLVRTIVEVKTANRNWLRSLKKQQHISTYHIQRGPRHFQGPSSWQKERHCTSDVVTVSVTVCLESARRPSTFCLPESRHTQMTRDVTSSLCCAARGVSLDVVSPWWHVVTSQWRSVISSCVTSYSQSFIVCIVLYTARKKVGGIKKKNTDR